MSDFKNKHITIKEYETINDYKEKDIDEELIEILNFTKEEVDEIENKGFFFMPNKVTYARKTATEKEVIENLSKNKRKKIRKALKSDFEIIQEEEVSEENYKEWYKNIHLPTLEKKEIGILTASEDWAEKDLERCEKIGIFAKNNGKIIAGIVARSFKETKNFPKRFSISYSGVSPEFKPTGINELLNVLIIGLVNKKGYEWIYRGMDTNLYGKHLSAGLPIFKTALNYEIIPRKAQILIKFNNLKDFDDTIFFLSFSKDSDKMIGNLIIKDESISFKEYEFPFLEKLRVYRYQNKTLTQIQK